MCCFVLTSRIWCFLCFLSCDVLILSQIVSACSMSIAKYTIYSWVLPSFFDCFLTVDEHLENPATLNLSRFGEFQKQSGSTLRSWSSISSVQIRQSEARCWTWISMRLIKLFWPWKDKRQRLVLMRKNVITLRLCEKPGSGKHTCSGPRNSKIVYQNSRFM